MATKKELLAQQVAEAVGAGKPANLETVDFSDPNRPKTCLEVDFPLLPINRLAAMEAHAGVTTKPIYQMSKYWARRPSSVFRSMLISAATKAPEDPSHAAKLVWDNYYANHQINGTFKDLKVVDIFMGGGTTLVEGSRLGMQMTGNDLNPVAWFVVKQELAQVDLGEVQRLLAEIEAVVRPQIIPFYYCDGPNGEKGTWTHLPTGRVEGPDFDPLALTPEQRPEYIYEGPEIIYTFWAKHGPCQVTGCGHRTPIMSSPVMAVKTLTVKSWDCICDACGESFQVEDKEARMAPDVPLFVAPTEPAYTILANSSRLTCPHCNDVSVPNLGKGKNKKVSLSLLVHPNWLAGSPSEDESGQGYGGSAQDDAPSTRAWNTARANSSGLLEVRGLLPDEVTCPATNVTFKTNLGTVPKKSHFACAQCGAVQDVLKSVKATGKTGPVAGYAFQGFAPLRASRGVPYGGRFFSNFKTPQARQHAASVDEWENRKLGDLAGFWPRSELPYGFMTHHLQGGVPNHGFTHWWTMFSPRQLLVHAQLLKAIVTVGDFAWEVREQVLGVFQNYVRNQCLFTFWHKKLDTIAPALSNNNFHPKPNIVETSVFSELGYGPWNSATRPLGKANDWKNDPWELVRVDEGELEPGRVGSTEKIRCGDRLSGQAFIECRSSTELEYLDNCSTDLVVTDPPFGGLLHYSELSDFFYVWLRLVLKNRYQDIFTAEYTPKSLEAVANKAREPIDPDGFYQRLLTQCWREAHRILKPGGLLAFTFHHSEDEPWVAVLESLFNAGFYLEATYPIRSDETKGDGEFGSKTIEYDIIHVCRKRLEEPKRVSWARLRRQVMEDVRQVQGLLQNHASDGLPAADVQVIRRGKALEYYSRHYGQVYVNDEPMGVREALIGINQMLEEDADQGSEPPPVDCEPMTRQFLRVFGSAAEIKRDQIQKFLRGTITTPDDFVQRGWCHEKKKVFYRTTPQELAREWAAKPRRLSSDLDQALVLIGACHEGSGINAHETLKYSSLSDALKPLLEWLHKHGPDAEFRQAASKALFFLQKAAPAPKQGSLFDEGDA